MLALFFYTPTSAAAAPLRVKSADAVRDVRWVVIGAFNVGFIFASVTIPRRAAAWSEHSADVPGHKRTCRRDPGDNVGILRRGLHRLAPGKKFGLIRSALTRTAKATS